MENRNHVNNIHLVVVSKCVENSAHVWKMKHAAKSTAGVPRAAKIALEDATVQRANVEAANVLVLLQAVNVILMYAEIVGSVVEVVRLMTCNPRAMVIIVET